MLCICDVTSVSRGRELNCSTVKCAAELVLITELSMSKRCRQRLHTVKVFMDTAKAFYTADRSKMLQTLREVCFSGFVFLWIESYLCGR